MVREYLDSLRRLLFMAYLLWVLFSFQAAFFLESLYSRTDFSFAALDDFFPAILIIWGLVLYNSQKCYLFRSQSRIEVVAIALKSSVAASAIFIIYLYFLDSSYLNNLQLGLFLTLSAAGLMAIRFLVQAALEYIRRRGFNYQTIIVVGRGRRAKAFAEKIFKNAHWGYKITGFLFSGYNCRQFLWSYSDIPAIGNLGDLPGIIKSRQVDWVVFAVENAELSRIEKAVAICDEMGVRAVVLTDLYPARFTHKRADEFFESPVLLFDTKSPDKFSLAIKDIIDRLAALISILIVSPVLIFTALTIKILSGGSILYKQERLGINGRKFTMYKFRTMIENAEKYRSSLEKLNEMDGPVFKIEKDPRITSWGRLLRTTSIDELPQLFNVLRGDMSLVGPRPPLSDEVIEYDPWQRRRLSMKPGITCLWQIGGRNDISFNRWMELDLKYIDNWSLWLDTKILARTIPAVLTRRGAR